jgi:hypothetical protein
VFGVGVFSRFLESHLSSYEILKHIGRTREGDETNVVRVKGLGLTIHVSVKNHVNLFYAV